MSRSKLAVGLDIGSSGVKLVQLKEKKGGYSLVAYGVAPLPPEAIVDGSLMNSAAIVQAIQELILTQALQVVGRAAPGLCADGVLRLLRSHASFTLRDRS